MTSGSRRGGSLLRSLLQGDGSDAVLARGVTGAFSANVAAVVVVYASHVVLARVLGTDAYGQYAYVLSWMNVLATLSLLGLDGTAVRRIAEQRAIGRAADARSLVSTSLGAVLPIAAVVAAIVVLLASAVGVGIPGPLRAVFVVGAIALVPWAALEYTASVFRGLKRVLWSMLPGRVLRPALLVVCVLVVELRSAWALDAVSAMAINAAVTLGCLLVAWLGLAGALGLPVPRLRGATRLPWRELALPMFVIAVLQQVLASADTLMLGALANTTEAGIYAVVSRTASVVPFVLAAVNVIAAPLFSELHARGDRAELQRTVTRAARASAGFGLVAAIGLVLLRVPLLGLFGPAFEVGAAALLVLVAGQVVNCACGSVGLLLSMTGGQSAAAGVLAFATVLNIALNALLIPPFGMLGAALATSASLMTWNLLMLRLVHRRLRIDPTVLGRAYA